MIYRLVRALWRAALFAFFRRIGVQGRGNVPARGPALLVANHTNAFIDGLLVLTRLERPVTLTVKSTLRRNPMLAALIRAMHVVEFHRSQDVGEGADPAKNVDAVGACAARLADGGCIVIFPEGVSHSDPALRPFRTGAARIALAYVDAHPRGPALALVPTGLHFEAKERFRSSAGMIFGEAMDVHAWRRDHPGGDAHALTEEIEARIRGLTANYDAEREMEIFGRAAELLETADDGPPPLGQEPAADVAARVSLIHRLQAGRQWLGHGRRAELEALEERVRGFGRKLHRLGITAAELFLPMEVPRAAFFVFREMELLAAGSPIAAWGWMNALPAYAVTKAVVMKMSKDRDHFASNSVFLGIPIFLLFWGMQIALVALVASPLRAVLYALSLPYAGAVALLYRDRAGSAWRRARTFLLLARRPGHRRKLVDEARSILADLRRLAAEFEAAETSNAVS
ncbi:1-acyl-sn-glycerol-3-phosphate acyltransferase [Longimicrobium sp.]|uniref:1-acyl-sn-glycerol-3-phosphate acyltransferase n=1 Tax=Longimicrobium sp. TaxID=2029185 RepID=UPI002B806E29|nr:1-acyl-sn-glycerol-3-phosphate acyltransferase [Longimicrobium sp.]HSU14067.1 1-acyl-sn-glycerol-3-phosphate acyltransferase [Longimicrobium sp.]